MSTGRVSAKGHCWVRQGAALLLGVIASWSVSGYTTVPIGEVQMSRGGALAEQAGGNARILGRGADILVGDALTTEAKSFLVIHLDDESKLTLRPASRLTIEAYNSAKGQENARLYLERGGLQAQSGRISRDGKGNYRLRTPYGEMQVEGARFNARLCEGDCETPEPGDGAQADPLAARVVKLRGQVHAEAAGRQRPLDKGSPLYPGDTVVTGERSNLGMAFRDGGRISLIEESRFAIQEYRYQGDPGRPETEGKASYELIKGGLRALTGYIGKGRPEDYELKTPVTTIGVRGTGFDAVCQGDCLAEDATGTPLPSGSQDADPCASQDEGLYIQVWDGTITEQLPIGTYELRQGQVDCLPNPHTPPVGVSTPPSVLQNLDAPRPDTLQVDMQELFGAGTRQGEQPGLYVYVEDGTVQLIGGQGALGLVQGESGYIGPGGILRLDSRGFLTSDPYPQPWRPIEGLRRDYSPLQGDQGVGSNFSCTVN